MENVNCDKNKWTNEMLPELTNFNFKFLSKSILHKTN